MDELYEVIRNLEEDSNQFGDFIKIDITKNDDEYTTWEKYLYSGTSSNCLLGDPLPEWIRTVKYLNRIDYDNFLLALFPVDYPIYIKQLNRDKKIDDILGV